MRIAIDVPNVIAPPIPWTTRKVMRRYEDVESAQSTDATMKTNTPMMKIFLLPRMSASRPNGTRKAAAASKYDVATQVSSTALIENSSDMEGRATLTADAMNGVWKDVSITTARTTRLLEVLDTSGLEASTAPENCPEI